MSSDNLNLEGNIQNEGSSYTEEKALRDYENLSTKEKEKIDNLIMKMKDKKTQIILYYKDENLEDFATIMELMKDPLIVKVYNSLSSTEKEHIDNQNLKERYMFLRKLARIAMERPGQTLSPEGPPPSFTARTPEGPPPSLKTAIIIPFRDSDEKKTRSNQLEKFVSYMADYLSDVNYKIFVIEQSNDNRKFNRGALLNIGFNYAFNSDDKFTNFIFHDVDLLPSQELKKYYVNTPSNNPIHIAAVWDRYNSNPKYFGGIVAFNGDSFVKINGYPNNFWGWGGEDDELYNRVKRLYQIEKASKGSIIDMEKMGIEEKLQYLRDNDLKFMKKQEALAQHESTWKINGLNSINFEQISEESCGKNCSKIIVNILSSGEFDLEDGPALNLNKELFEKDFVQGFEDSKKISPKDGFDNLMKMFYDQQVKEAKMNGEFEVRFGTKGIKYLTKNDYDNVVKLLKSFGFTTANPSGLFSLRARCQFLDSSTGRFKMSDIRTEINGLNAIENYCRSNDIKAVYKETPQNVSFINKRPYITPEKVMVRPVNFDEFNFRASYSTEEKVKKGIENYILDNWRKSKKEFRYLNRVTFTHPDYPVLVDLSITKSGNTEKDKRGFTHIIPVYTLDESNVLNNKESYEIEIEVNNKKIGPGTNFTTPNSIATALRKVIKYVLSGLQGTMYPISYPEQEEVLRDYMKMIWQDEYEPSRRITTANFIGPNSITLQLTNVAPIDENSTSPNIRKDFIVTDKADGERHLMYISKTGKIYLINTNMDVKFTGAKTTNEDCFNTLLDGELIANDKNNEFINLYAAFDIYYHKNRDVRDYSFVLREEEGDIYKSRYYLLEKLKTILKPISILDNPKEKITQLTENKPNLSPIRFQVKKFYPMSSKQTIFDGCRLILEREKQGLFEYEIDGLIFTHEFYGVGSNVIGKAGPKTKITWEYSFKWKPPQYNTIDFLVTTVKSPNGDDLIHSLFEDGTSTQTYTQLNQYKIVELRCGFSEKNDGFINPCQDIIDDNLPEYKPRFEDKQSNDYMPKRFYPTEPYDVNAGLCKIMLKSDDASAMQMFTKSNELITDNSIVEFAYDIDGKEGWRWIPLRVRHDKTAKLLRGEKEYGNSYKVCNENWKSIHPSGRITEDMLMTGLNIPELLVSEDVYYNTPAGKMKTEALKNFHNLYVKKLLISGVSKQGDSLIDFACGKAGDLSKWIASKLAFVFGVDLSEDNLENRLDGACARYLKARKINKHVPYALFVNGNSGLNIRDGTAMRNDKAKKVTSAVFGNGPKEADKIGKGVARQYGKGESGFNVSSCQFAIHYFFENPDTLKGFLRNVAECTKLNGYFIGTCYDGKLIFNELKKYKKGEGVQLNEDGKKIWEVLKEYGSDNFDDDSSSIGYKIKVYQESINQHIYEYLVNFDYLDRIMDSYGFKLINRDEANEIGLPSGSALFSELFINMLDDIKRNKFRATMYGEAPNMTSFEKKISFLNRYFIYKKVREVNVEKLQLELGEYEETVIEREKEDTEHAIVVAKQEEKKIKPKVKKLGKKIELIPATEAINESAKINEQLINKDKDKKEKSKKKVKMLVIEDSDEE